MKREDKELLLKDLSSRLMYDCKVAIAEGGINGLQWNNVTLNSYLLYQIEEEDCLEYVKPYLRPMDSMTDKERKEYEDFIIHREHINAQGQEWDIDCFSFNSIPRLIDWLNAHHFDYRGLIEKGLAIKVVEENNPYKI